MQGGAKKLLEGNINSTSPRSAAVREADTISEATCDISEHPQQGVTPRSVSQPRTFLYGDDPSGNLPAAGEPGSNGDDKENQGQKGKAKGGGRWWKPSFAMRSQSSAKLQTQQPQQLQERRDDNAVEEFSLDGPGSRQQSGGSSDTTALELMPSNNRASALVQLDNISECGSLPGGGCSARGYPAATRPQQWSSSPASKARSPSSAIQAAGSKRRIVAAEAAGALPPGCTIDEVEDGFQPGLC